jgi:hypothetical protein
MKEIPDEILKRLIPLLIEIEGSKVEQLYLIDKDYRLVESLTITDDLSRRRATETRWRLLQSGQLLVTIAIGIILDAGPRYAVVEHYPARGQLETYTLTYDRPRFVWSDPEEPENQEAIRAAKEIWMLE